MGHRLYSDARDGSLEPNPRNEYDAFATGASDRYNAQSDFANRVGHPLWSIYRPRTHHMGGTGTRYGRGAKYRMSYKSNRFPRPCTYSRYCSRKQKNFRDDSRKIRPDFNMCQDRQQNHENKNDLNKTDFGLSNEMKADIRDEQECSFFCFWRIENFCINETSSSCSINSQTFEIQMIKGSQWHLRVEHAKHKHLSLCLFREGEQESNDIRIQLSILAINGWNLIRESIPIEFNSYIKTELINWNEISHIKNRLPDDCLTVSCHVSIQSALFNPVQYFMPSRMISHKLIIHSPILEFSDLNPNEVLNFPIPSILIEHLFISDDMQTRGTQTENAAENSDSEDLLQLFKEKNFSYVTLRTANKDFAVHKAILCAKSPVFNAMFRAPLEEGVNNVVRIEDIDSDSLSLLLQFYYLEPFRDLEWEEAARLYYAAHKFQVHLLKNKCRSFLKNKLSNKNICDSFILADTHKDEDLRESGLEYFCKNSKTILCSSEWTHFLFNRVDLASKVLFKLGESM